jgi:hypothetical protein
MMPQGTNDDKSYLGSRSSLAAKVPMPTLDMQ